MRRVTIKALYRNLSKEMADLPFEVTRLGECVGFMVASLDQSGESLDNLHPKVEKTIPKSGESLDAGECVLNFFKPMPKKGDK